jgi:hypothetical protein
MMLAEPVHALSLDEAVLLAREWPHLAALIDGTAPGLPAETARELAARTLKVVQGAPETDRTRRRARRPPRHPHHPARRG